jgi:hypothetical protein
MTAPLPMTRGRRLALAIGAPLALLIIGWTAVSGVAWAGQASYRVNLTLPVRGHLASLAIDSGNISLGPGAAGRLRVTGTAHYALVRSTVAWQSTSSEVSLSSRCHQITGPCSFDYVVAVPAGIATRISDSSGDISARVLPGPFTLEADSGNVAMSMLSGDLHVKDKSGDITGASLTSQDLVVEEDSGNITMTGLASRDVAMTNSSGDIRLTFAKVPGQVKVSDLSGDVTLVLPPGGTAYNVNASTASGQRVVNVPTNPASPHVITVTDESGNITVTG